MKIVVEVFFSTSQPPTKLCQLRSHLENPTGHIIARQLDQDVIARHESWSKYDEVLSKQVLLSSVAAWGGPMVDTEGNISEI